MDKHELIVGFDLCSEYSQISCYDTEKHEPDTAGNEALTKFPTALCRLYDNDAYVAGQAALEAAAAGKGVLIRGFTENLSEEPEMDVDGISLPKADLICEFISRSLSILESLTADSRVKYLTVTAPDMNLALADAIKKTAALLGLTPGQTAMQSHMLSYEYYALSQKKELWTHDVGLFEYDREGLRYHHLTISWKHHPATVTSETSDLTAYLNGQELDRPNIEMDRQFVKAITEVSARRTISTFYLVGEGFDNVGTGSSWMKQSLQQLCSLRRHVFVGQNLFARGACYNSFYMAEPDRHPDFQAVNSDLLTKEIYIKTIHKKSPQKTILIPAGTAWYSASGEKRLIIDGCDELIIRVHDILSNIEQKTVLHLDDLPKRPSKTIMLLLQTRFETENICHITASDIGFGELFKSSRKEWETTFDITGIPDMPVPAEGGTVIEALKPAVHMAHTIRMSGVHIYSLEELCWYISENVYTLTPEIFDESLFSWMDLITGNHNMALAIRNYQKGDKPLKEIVRLLLGSVDYLSSQEIAAVYNRLAILEKQNPVEHAKIAADNYCKYGHYMAALKNYQHVAYQMDHDYERDVTKQFRAAVYHNMGVTYLKLHNVAAAVEALKMAFDLEKTEDFLRHYLYALELSGDKEKLMDEAEKLGVTMGQLSAVRRDVQKASEDYESSEQGKAMAQGLALKQEKTASYSSFVRDYITEQQKRYDIN